MLNKNIQRDINNNMMPSTRPSDTKEQGKKGSNLTGIDELAGFVYNGNKNGNHYTRTTRALADYCGSNMHPGVWDLIVHGKEAEFEEPEEPAGKVTEYKWIDQLDTSYIAGEDNYPKTLREALTQVCDREEKLRKAKSKHKAKQKTADRERQPVETSFAQAKTKFPSKLKKKKCSECGGMGHTAAQCPTVTSDSESEYFQESDTECVTFGG